MPTISLDELEVTLDEEGLREEAWLELFYDLLYVAGCIKLGAVTKKAELDQVMYCGLIFSLLWTTWYQLQRYLSRFHKNNLAHLFLLFLQCASVSQICINLIGLKYIRKEIVEAKNITFGVLLSKCTILMMYGYLIYFNKKKVRDVKGSLLGLSLSIICHIVCLPMTNVEVIFYLWIASVVIELGCDVLARIKYETVNQHAEHHNAERLGCFTMVVLGESVIQMLLPDIELLSDSSVHRYAIIGLSGALVFNLAVLHFDKLPSHIHNKSDSERGASSLAPHSNKLRVIWTLLHLPMTFFMLLVGVSMKYMFDVKKSSEDTVWMLSISVGAVLIFYTLMRFLRQGFKGKKKRLVIYGIRIVIAVVTAILPMFLPLDEWESYWTILPFTFITSIFVVIDMRQHFSIVKKVEHTERVRVKTIYEETGHLPDRYRKSVSLPSTLTIEMPESKKSSSSSSADSKKSGGNIWSKLGSYTSKDSTSSVSKPTSEPQYSYTHENPLASIEE